MRKLFITLIYCLLLVLPVSARDCLPKFSDTIREYGIGVYFAPKEFNVYEKPDEKSPILDTISWNDNNLTAKNTELEKPFDATVAFIPSRETVLFAVLEDSNGWCRIIYSQNEDKEGWVKLSAKSAFMTWREVMNKYGRTNGLYLWSNTPRENQVLRISPDESLPPNSDFVYPRLINLQLLRGNWMLIKVVDFDRGPRVGWFQWRTADGRMKLFPKLAE